MPAKKPSPKRQLATYRAKRDFTKTREPSGEKAAAESHRYLIQKHAARRLHYDFRLEMDGVLKSWAVTRGPSLNPADKRLAVHVEDHPLDYGNFEGTIPQGQYGGGTVMLWDEGSWEPIGDPHRTYKKGHLDFELRGKRLKGRWHLVRMHGDARGGKHENWLLIKGKDQYANEDNGDYALEHYQKSAVSGRSMETIASGNKQWQSKPKTQAKAKKKSAAVKEAKAARANLASPPDFVAPQLATLVTEPPQGEGWVHEIKFDGYRLLARLEGGKARLITRANNDWTTKFRGLAGTVAELDAQNALLDGEAVHMEDDGTMSFHGLQHALSTGEESRIHYYIFDLLFLDGVDWRSKPLFERKQGLQKLLKNAPPSIHYSEHFKESGEAVLHHACAIALEGIISKRADAAYHSGRDEIWVKSKCGREQEVVIGGYTIQPKHPGFLGAFLMGTYAKDEFVFAGKVGTGFSHEEGRKLVKRLQKMRRKTSPFKNVPAPSRKGAVWVEPKLVAQIHFSEWTPDGRMRHPSFQGLREDKPASEVTREKEKPMPKSTSRKSAAAPASKGGGNNGKVTIASVSLTHPDKKLYAGDNITKRDLALYYEKVAPLMLPHVARRPISLVRCPEGEGKPCFFQRHGADTLSSYIKPVNVAGEKQPYLMVEDVRGLIGLVQMGVLEIHIWGAEAKTPERPDRLVFDLDPAPDVDFAEVKKAAIEVRDLLKQVKLASFLKTTGGKGLHIVVPFQKGPTWDQVKNFTRTFAEEMVKREPDRFTANSRKNARAGKIYIDYLRNGEGASSVAPYSTRAREGAPVAAPLNWNELAALKSGHSFTIQNIATRLKKDPWKDMAKTKQRLPL